MRARSSNAMALHVPRLGRTSPAGERARVPWSGRPLFPSRAGQGCFLMDRGGSGGFSCASGGRMELGMPSAEHIMIFAADAFAHGLLRNNYFSVPRCLDGVLQVAQRCLFQQSRDLQRSCNQARLGCPSRSSCIHWRSACPRRLPCSTAGFPPTSVGLSANQRESRV